MSRTVVVPAYELSWRFSRSSGPGGQSVNTSDTRVELSLDLSTTTALTPVLRARAMQRLAGRLVDGVLTVTSSEHRSQLRNRQAALSRLADELRRAVAPPSAPRKRTQPTRAARERRLDEKRHRGRIKQLRRPSSDD